MSNDLSIKEEKTLDNIIKLIQTKYGKHINLSQEEIFLVSGFVNEKGLSFYSNDFYIIQFNAWNKELKIYDKKNQIVVSIEGIRKVARQMGDYGIRFVCIFEDGTESKVPLPNKKLYAIEAILTTIYNGEKLEKSKSVLLEEYTTNQNLWKSKPFVMLCKVAEATVLRASFNLAGMYIAEEFNKNTNPDIKEVQSEVVTEEPKVILDNTDQKRKEMLEVRKSLKEKKEQAYKLIEQLGYTKEEDKEGIFKTFKKTLNIGDTPTLEEADILIENLQQRVETQETTAKSFTEDEDETGFTEDIDDFGGY